MCQETGQSHGEATPCPGEACLRAQVELGIQTLVVLPSERQKDLPWWSSIPNISVGGRPTWGLRDARTTHFISSSPKNVQ